MKLVFAAPTDILFGTDYIGKMNAAALGAMTDASELAKAGGRSSIAGGGFSTKWQNALRNRVYPNKEKPLSPAALVWHKIKYASVFETGATVTGKPMLWVPLSGVPLGKGSHPLTPAQYIARIGPLRSAKDQSKPMLLGRGTRAGITRATERKVSLRKRAVKSGSILGDWVPLFVGVSKVRDPQRFNVTTAVKQAAAQLPALYDKHFGA